MLTAHVPLKQLINNRGDDRSKSAPAPTASPASAQANSLAAAAGARSPSAPQDKPIMGGKNVLSSDVEIKGSLKFSNDLIIDGKIDGEVSSDGSLTVGENAIVKGEIKTKSVTIFGKVQANVTVAERCQLKTNAVLEGDVSAGTLAIEEGATFMGSSAVGRSKNNKTTSTASTASKHTSSAGSAPAKPTAAKV